MAYAKTDSLEVSYQRHPGKGLTISSLKREAQCIVFADFCGVNILIRADFKHLR